MDFKSAFEQKPDKEVETLVGEVIEGETYVDPNSGQVGPLTPQLVEVENTRRELAEERRSSELVVRDKENRPAKLEKGAVQTDLLSVPKECNQCYLMDKCRHYQKDASCYYKNSVDIKDPGDLLELVKMVISMQGERVMFGRLIEQSEGGYIDKNLSDEMKRLLEYMKIFKELGQKDQDEISIRVKGGAAQEASKQGGVLSQIFGGGAK